MPISTLTIIRYPAWSAPAGLLSMMCFRFPLWFNKQVSFFKLMGCGKNGSFDIRPDWRQWAVMTHRNDSLPKMDGHDGNKINKLALGSFIQSWIRFTGAESLTLILEPMEGHGTWDGKPVFGELPHKTAYEGPVAVLTRATIRLNRLKHFWKHVAPVSARMAGAPGFVHSVGIGEIPWVKQATFSVWLSKDAMKQFAYNMKEHQDVIRLTRQERWYSEDMFVRFRIRAVYGSLKGQNPIPENLYL